MISVTKKSHMANLPLFMGKPIWAGCSSVTACAINYLTFRLFKQQGKMPIRMHPGQNWEIGISLQHKQGEQGGQVNQRCPEDPSGLIVVSCPEKADGARQEPK